MNSKFPFMSAMREAVENKLFTKSDKNADAVTSYFLDWLNNDARLKPLPDLQQHLLDLEPRIRRMAKNLELSIQDSKVVIRTDAESESLLRLFRRGSDWFDPHPDVNAAIILALAGKSQFI